MTRSVPHSRLLSSLVLAGLVGVAIVSASASAHADGRSLHGTWLVEVRLLTACTGGTELRPFWSMLTFASGGTLTGTTMNPAFAPGQRGPDHGTWRRERGGDYAAASVAFIMFPTPPSPPTSPGFQSGVQRIDQAITLTDVDTFASTATVTFYDANAQLYRQGCALATGRRFE